jgi:hypothetical protein
MRSTAARSATRRPHRSAAPGGAGDGCDTDPVFAFVDPTPLIGERIAAEIGPLVEALSQTTDVWERRRLKREIRRRAADVRESLCNPFICW